MTLATELRDLADELEGMTPARLLDRAIKHYLAAHPNDPEVVLERVRCVVQDVNLNGLTDVTSDYADGYFEAIERIEIALKGEPT